MNDATDPMKERGGEDAAPEDAGAKLPADQDGAGEPTRSRPTFRPRVDIAETEAGLVLTADLPGAKREGLDISLERRELTIRASVEEREPEGLSPILREYQVGDYERRFQLTGDFDTDAIEAELRDGVLTLTIPKAAEAQARRIELKAG